MLLDFKIFAKKIIQLQQKISAIHYFSPSVSLRFTNQKVTN